MTSAPFWTRFDGQFAASIGSQLIAIAGIIVLALASARIVWLVAAGAEHQVSPPRASAVSGGPSVLADYSVLERITPFYRAGSQPVQATAIEIAPSEAEEAPETDLDMTLHGVIASGVDAGRAVISVSSGEQIRYAIGDDIEDASGVSIHRIFADGVLINRSGEIERLPFRGDGALSAISLVGDAEPDLRGTQAAASPPTEASLASTSPPAPTRPSPTKASAQLTRTEVFDLAAGIWFDPNTGQAGPGFAVFPTRNAALFQKAGLRPGDIVREAGGVLLTSEADFAQLLADLENQSSLDLLLIRNEAERLLTIRLSD